VLVHAASVALSGGLQLDATAPGQFGELISAGAADLTAPSLTLNATGYTPDCGTTVTALTAAAVAGLFSKAEGTAPNGGTWLPESTATTAGAALACGGCDTGIGVRGQQVGQQLRQAGPVRWQIRIAGVIGGQQRDGLFPGGVSPLC